MEKDKFPEGEKGGSCCIEIISRKQQDGKSTVVTRKTSVYIPPKQ